MSQKSKTVFNHHKPVLKQFVIFIIKMSNSVHFQNNWQTIPEQRPFNWKHRLSKYSFLLGTIQFCVVAPLVEILLLYFALLLIVI